MYTLVLVVIDDASLSKTATIVNRHSDEGFPARCKVNEINSSYGVGTRKAIDAGLQSDSDLIVTVGGDK